MAVALIAGACTSSDDGADTTTSTTAATTGTTAAPGGTEATIAATPSGFTYNVGMISDITNDNFWAFIGLDSTVYESYVLSPTKPSLFTVAYPGIVIAPDVALGLPVAAVQEGDVWTVTQPMRDDYTWSDGSALTANDVVFTYETVRDAELGGDWISAYPYTEESTPRLINVEAIDDFTVKFTLNSKPGAVVWPHNVGVASIMPRAPWESVVTEALASEDPAAVIYGANSLEVGDLSGGPVIYNGRDEGAFVENVKNENYSNAGLKHTFWQDGSYAQNDVLLHGDGDGDVAVEYTEGPFLDRTVFSIYANEAEAMRALVDGEIDFWINELGATPGLRQQGLEADNLTVTVNPTNGFRYLAFNLRKSPGKFLGFRQAMAYFDKENLTQNVLQGVAFPLYVMVPEGNQAWYNEEVAEQIASQYVGLSTQDRLNKAYEALEADGFTWATPPERDDDRNIVTPGAGIIDPDGIAVPELEIITPTATYDPLRATAALRLEDWAENLGVPANAKPTVFDTILATLWPGVGTEPIFDMYILGWNLGNPAWPMFHEAFFHSRNFPGINTTGYSDPEFDVLADTMFTETDQAVAFDQVWQMERKLAEDLPYVVLFDAAITEFYNNSLEFPYAGSLSGIQFQDGMQNVVAK
ncbi:MAG: ABC transporter substrate-binding protein [Acidobacteria bacterium]|nr:ABC transporter substrate-binding protein [Acidobacteriota bacterium]